MGEEPGRRRAPGCRAASRAEAEEIRLEDPGLGPVMLVASGRGGHRSEGAKPDQIGRSSDLAVRAEPRQR